MHFYEGVWWSHGSSDCLCWLQTRSCSSPSDHWSRQSWEDRQSWQSDRSLKRCNWRFWRDECAWNCLVLRSPEPQSWPSSPGTRSWWTLRLWRFLAPAQELPVIIKDDNLIKKMVISHLHCSWGKYFEAFLEPNTLGIEINHPVNLGVSIMVCSALVGGEVERSAVIHW